MRLGFLGVLFILSFNVYAEKLQVKNSCFRTGDFFEFNLNFHVKYKKDSSDQIFRIHCSLKDNLCRGVLIKNNDKVIEINDIVPLQDVSVFRYDESSVQIKWGPRRIFTYQNDKVEYSEDLTVETAKAEASCK